MAGAKHEVLGNDFSEMERSILSEICGKEDADKIIAEANTEEDDFDPELQEILDDVLPLDEM